MSCIAWILYLFPLHFKYLPPFHISTIHFKYLSCILNIFPSDHKSLPSISYLFPPFHISSLHFISLPFISYLFPPILSLHFVSYISPLFHISSLQFIILLLSIWHILPPFDFFSQFLLTKPTFGNLKVTWLLWTSTLPMQDRITILIYLSRKKSEILTKIFYFKSYNWEIIKEN